MNTQSSFENQPIPADYQFDEARISEVAKALREQGVEQVMALVDLQSVQVSQQQTASIDVVLLRAP